MTQRDVDARNAAVVDLLEELPEIGPALVVHPCIGNETHLVAMLHHANAEFNILTESHAGKTVCFVEDFA